MNTGLRLLGEDFRYLRMIEPRERLRMLAEGFADKVYWAPDGTPSIDKMVGRTDGSIKIRTRPSQEIGSDLPLNDSSKTYLTRGDMERNAGGQVDSLKRHLVYKMRKEELPDGTPKKVPAFIRCYGRDAENKPHSGILGNPVDVSMSRVEAWYGASAESARCVTIACGTVVGITERPIEPQSTFAL